MTPVGIEPTTPRLKVECSKPAELRSHYYCGADGLRSRSSGFSVQCNDHICHNSFLGERRGSNPRQLEPQSSTLPLSYNHHVCGPSGNRALSFGFSVQRTHQLYERSIIFAQAKGVEPFPSEVLETWCIPLCWPVFCDPGGTRTHNLLIKSQKLHQLSYEIICSPAGSRTRPHKLKAYCLPPVCYEGL